MKIIPFDINRNSKVLVAGAGGGFDSLWQLDFNSRSIVSLTCSHCGYQQAEFKRPQRIYHCEQCGLELDRDFNAAINIECESIRFLA